jgi:hypothetical protein
MINPLLVPGFFLAHFSLLTNATKASNVAKPATEIRSVRETPLYGELRTPTANAVASKARGWVENGWAGIQFCIRGEAVST